MKLIHRSYSLSAHQRDFLDNTARDHGISASELLRRIVDDAQHTPRFQRPLMRETPANHAHGNP